MQVTILALYFFEGYGNLEIVDLSNVENQLELKFAEANIESINNGDVEIGYSKLESCLFQPSNFLLLISDFIH